MKTFPARSEGGFSLVEVALALGVAVFCLVPVFGLLPIGISTNHTSYEQTGAANVATAILSDLGATGLVTPPTSQTSPRYQITIPATPAGSSSPTSFFVQEDGTLSGTMGNNADATASPHYRVTLFFTSTGTSGTNASGNPNATAVHMLITWPALADANVTSAPSRFAGSFETIAGLIRR